MAFTCALQLYDTVYFFPAAAPGHLIHGSSCKVLSAILLTVTPPHLAYNEDLFGAREPRLHNTHDQEEPTNTPGPPCTIQYLPFNFHLPFDLAKMTVFPRPSLCTRHPDPLISRTPSPSSAYHGDPRSTHFPMLSPPTTTPPQRAHCTNPWFSSPVPHTYTNEAVSE